MTEQPAHPPRSTGRRLKIIVALAFAAAAVTLAVLFQDDLRLANLARHEAQLRRLQVEYPVAVHAIAFGSYVLVTGLSIPAATGLSLLYGWYFGFWRGLFVVSFGSTAGATLAFLTSRYLLRESVRRRFGERLQRVNQELEREGAFYLFSIRLLPVIPFFVVNVVMGLTPMATWTYWWVSQLGMLPGTAVYIYAGSSAPDLQTLSEQGVRGLPVGQITVALMLLGLVPLVTRLLLRRWRRMPVS